MLLQILLAFAEAEKVKDKKYTPITLEEVVVWVAVILSAIAVTVYVAGFFRGNALGKVTQTSNHLDEFKRLHEEGMLQEEEFSQVKATISQQNVARQIEFQEDTSSNEENNNQS